MEDLEYPRIRGSTAKKGVPSVLKICAAEDTIQSRCLQATCERKITCLGPLMRICHHENLPVMERESGTAESQALCCAHKPQEVWDGERELVEKSDLELQVLGEGSSRVKEALPSKHWHP